MSFAIIPAVKAENPKEDLPAFDIFSFGPDEGAFAAPRQGLNFNSLGLKMTIPLQTVGQGDPSPPILELVENEITFNSTASFARDKSLYKNFQLEPRGLLSGNAKAEEKREEERPDQPRLPAGDHTIQPAGRELRCRGLARIES